MRKDVLAAGGRKATFAAGQSHRGDEVVINPGIVAPEGETPEIKQEDVLPSQPIVRKHFRPLGDTILVRRVEVEVYKGLLLLPDSDTAQKERPAEGIVLEIGADVKTLALGERVAFGKYAGQEFPINGEVLLIMSLSEVKGVIEDERPNEGEPTIWSATALTSTIARA